MVGCRIRRKPIPDPGVKRHRILIRNTAFPIEAKNNSMKRKVNKLVWKMRIKLMVGLPAYCWTLSSVASGSLNIYIGEINVFWVFHFQSQDCSMREEYI